MPRPHCPCSRRVSGRDPNETLFADKRISGYLKDGLIQREYLSKASRRPEARSCYKLTKVGHELCRKKLGLEFTYHAQFPTHDLRLAEQYLKLTPEEQSTWQTESEARDKLLHRGQAAKDPIAAHDLKTGELSPPDAVYCSQDGAEVAFEVVTGNYTASDIAAKKATADLLGCAYEEVRT